MKILINRGFAKFYLNPTIPCVEMHWDGFVRTQDFREILETALTRYQILREEQPELMWLAETSKLRVISNEDRQWVEEVFNPKLFAAGLTHMAVVIPKNAFGEIAIKDIAETNEKYEQKAISYHMKLFGEYTEAQNWLKQTNGIAT